MWKTLLDEEVLGLYRVQLHQRAVGLVDAYGLHRSVHHGLCSRLIDLLLFDGYLGNTSAIYGGIDKYLSHRATYASVVKVFVEFLTEEHHVPSLLIRHVISDICARYGGGGHAVVGGVNRPRAEAGQLFEIANENSREICWIFIFRGACGAAKKLL